MRILIVFCFVEKKIKKLQVEKTWSNENVRKVHRLRYEGMTFHCFVREFKNAMNNGFKNKIWVSIFIFFGIPNCLTMANGVKPKGGKKKLRIKRECERLLLKSQGDKCNYLQSKLYFMNTHPIIHFLSVEKEKRKIVYIIMLVCIMYTLFFLYKSI